jgi:cyclic pyranopterin phosphate synthase
MELDVVLTTDYGMEEEKKLTHVNSTNNPTMVDVSDKRVTKRVAHARSIVKLPSEVTKLFDSKDIATPKGPVFTTAIIAGTMGAKQTSSLIPFCHPLPIENCSIQIRLEENNVIVDCTVTTTHKTGVEMEALTGASVAALTIYDMCKAVSHNIEITETKLIKKTGGKSDINNS